MSVSGIVNNNIKYLVSGTLIAALFLSPMSHAATPVCGNSIAEAPEQCDDGNTNSGDGCSSACVIEPRCGNGIAEPGEQCDLGSPINGTRCSSCQLVIPSLCGNGILNSGEQCDPGLNPNSCNLDCTFSACGDGKMGPSEQCDGAGRRATCNSNCKFSNCLDGNLNPDSGEQCDPGQVTGSCNWNCKNNICGDSVLNQLAGEQCDPPGNMTSGDTCSPTCQVILAPATTSPSAASGGLDAGTIAGIAIGIAGLIGTFIPVGIWTNKYLKRNNLWCHKPKGAAVATAPAPAGQVAIQMTAPNKPNPFFNAAPAPVAQGAAQGAASVPAVAPAAASSGSAVKPSKPLPVAPSTPPAAASPIASSATAASNSAAQGSSSPSSKVGP